MSHKLKDINIKNWTYYFFNDIINISFDSNKIKVHESYTKYEIKKKKWKYEDLWIKIRDLIRSITINSDGYDEKYMKIKFNSDDELPLIKR